MDRFYWSVYIVDFWCRLISHIHFWLISDQYWYWIRTPLSSFTKAFLLKNASVINFSKYMFSFVLFWFLTFCPVCLRTNISNMFVHLDNKGFWTHLHHLGVFNLDWQWETFYITVTESRLTVFTALYILWPLPKFHIALMSQGFISAWRASCSGASQLVWLPLDHWGGPAGAGVNLSFPQWWALLLLRQH